MVQAVVILIIIHQVGGVDLVMATPMSIVILMAGGVDQVMVQPLFIIMVDMVGDMAPRCTIVMAGVDENRPEIERSTTDLREKMAGVMYVMWSEGLDLVTFLPMGFAWIWVGLDPVKCVR